MIIFKSVGFVRIKVESVKNLNFFYEAKEIEINITIYFCFLQEFKTSFTIIKHEEHHINIIRSYYCSL